MMVVCEVRSSLIYIEGVQEHKQSNQLAIKKTAQSQNV